jgi:hypothetical protein
MPGVSAASGGRMPRPTDVILNPGPKTPPLNATNAIAPRPEGKADGRVATVAETTGAGTAAAVSVITVQFSPPGSPGKT